ncbi:MAG: hypothetical protein WHV44_13775 [Anaerolineales bacterium]
MPRDVCILTPVYNDWDSLRSLLDALDAQARHDGEHQSVGAHVSADGFHGRRRVLGLDREHHHMGLPGRGRIVPDGTDAPLAVQLGILFLERAGSHDAGHLPAPQQAGNHGLRHLAGTDERDGLVREHGRIRQKRTRMRPWMVWAMEASDARLP